MIDRKVRKNEKEGVMQRENERIICHLMHFNEKDKEWSERPYLLLEDMAIVFDILDLDDPSIQRIDHKKANEEQWSDQFLWESAKKNTKQLLPAKFEPVYKDFEDIPKIDRYLWCQTKYRDMEQVLFVMKIFWMIFLENITRVCISCQPVFMKCYYCLMTEKIRKRIYCTY